MRIYHLFFYCLLVFQIQGIAQSKVFGKVTDAQNNPLIGAAVYLNNTSIGTTTDDEGEFELTVKDGVYDLIISYLGYKTIQYALTDQNKNKPLAFKMKLKNNVLGEIVLTNKRMSKEERAYFMGKFKRSFLGKTNMSLQCTILNEEVIKFSWDDETAALKAYISEPIQIEHKGLGYLITYDLVYFQLDRQRITYLGYTRYEEMKGSKRKQNRWKKRRRIAYNGSTMHFFRAIVDNQLQEQGFVVDHFKRVPNPVRPHDSVINKAERALRNISVRQGGMTVGSNVMISNKVVRDKKIDSLTRIIRKARFRRFIDQDIKDNLKIDEFTSTKDKVSYLEFSDLLKVKYMNEKEEDRYRPGPARLDHQVSIISLYVQKTPIEKTGVLVRPLDMFMDGYWGYEKIADALPLDYSPED